MPRLKPVKRLYDICIYSFNKAVLAYIDKNVDNKCVSVVGELRYIIIENINPSINECLLHNIDEKILQNEFQKLTLLKLYRNIYLRKLNLHFKLPNVQGFYEEYLNGLSKLVVLNLTKVCTDEILEVVGENCPFIEVIYIISKTESVATKNRRNLNALKLKFFVSDKGLEHLHKCQHLKKIYMDKIIRSSCGGRKITHEGLRMLLCALPTVRYISYEDMGRVLEERDQNMKPLSLIHIHDNHIDPKHILTFNELCPLLQTLCLAIPTVTMDPDISHVCLQQLSESPLSIKNITLKGFPFGSSLEKYLSIKGEQISTLSIEHEFSITTRSLFKIGIYCKNLENLAVKLLHPSHSDYEIVESSGVTKCFNHLKTLKLFGVNWKPFAVFALCVHNAKNIESLILFNKYYTEPLDEVFETLAFKNSLPELTKLCLLDGFTLNSKNLINFILGCKKLKEITFRSGSKFYDVLEELIKRQNLDLSLKMDCVANYGYCLCQNS